MDLHALLEETEGLRKVTDAEVIASPQFGVLDLEVEPLLMSFRIRVDLAEEIVLLDDCFITSALHIDYLVNNRIGLDPFKITTLDGRIELKVFRILQAMISLDLRQVLFQLVCLLWHIFVILLQVKLLIDCFGDESVLAHSFDVLERHVQHVLSHQVSVLRCVGLIDLIDQHKLFIVLINLRYGWSENGLNRLGG